jgi:hypothetical protein
VRVHAGGAQNRKPKTRALLEAAVRIPRYIWLSS